VRVDIPIVADCKNALTAINKWFDIESSFQQGEQAGRLQPWLTLVNEWTAKHPLAYKDNGTIIKPQYVIETLHRLTGGKAIITTEVGQTKCGRPNFTNLIILATL
jgi:acetolactate synthase I/II/III large subunit